MVRQIPPLPPPWLCHSYVPIASDSQLLPVANDSQLLPVASNSQLLPAMDNYISANVSRTMLTLDHFLENSDETTLQNNPKLKMLTYMHISEVFVVPSLWWRQYFEGHAVLFK